MEEKKMEPGIEIPFDPPLRVNIRATKDRGPVFGVRPDEKQETSLEKALHMVEEVKKVHPNAEITVEVEV